MSLKRTPLPAHTWGEPDASGDRECEDCGSTWGAEYEEPPKWPCKRQPIKRNTRLDAVSETNSGREHQIDEGYREFCRRRPCDACGEKPPNDPAHDRSFGAGWGDWIEGEGNICTLCRPCHNLCHDQGRDTFREITGCDTDEASTEAGESYRQQGGDDD